MGQRYRATCSWKVIPTPTQIQPLGRVEPVVVPGAELAVIVHPGSLADVDRAAEHWPPTWQTTRCR